jgi:hypothetical protein
MLTQRLFRMVAAEQGAILNLSKLGQSLGLSHHTVESYLDHLEGAFLIRRLPPFEANLRKRFVKSPRITGVTRACSTLCSGSGRRTISSRSRGSARAGKDSSLSRSSPSVARAGRISTLTSFAPTTVTKRTWFWTAGVNAR